MLTRQRWIVLLGSLLLIVVTARLGLWQLDRAAQKKALQAALDQRRQLPALEGNELARVATAVDAQLHRAVRLRGRWQADSTVALDNRQMAGQPGFFIVTPLRLDDGSAVLVQRGWLPRQAQDRALMQPPPLPSGEVVVHGRIAKPPARLYEFDAAASGPLRQNLDIERFAQESRLQLLPLSVLQTGDEGADGMRRDWAPPAVDVHKHHGYAFQWFALSLLTAVLLVWFQVIAPWRRRTTPSAP